MSLDGSDGGVGGRLANSVTVRGVTRVGTATNKADKSSSLMCGSNATGEPLPIHVMFPSDATREENYGIRASWIDGLPSIDVKFGREQVETTHP